MTTSTFTLSVSELTKAIKFKLEADFSRVCVQGEISNFKRQSSGHLYFTLKDSSAQIQAVMFSRDASSLSQEPKIGDQVEVVGELNVYPPRGNYQIIVRSLKASGLGQLLLLLEERKKKYLQLGYFDLEKKKKIPVSPKTIGVITSPTGAVIRDILQILTRRSRGFHVLLNPVRVQGEGAKEEISQAIDLFNDYQLADVLILARGGGSMEDLWPFNESLVVESIFKSKIPIISAVGHETDTTLADLAADLRAPTPSAAAELVSFESHKTIEKLESYSQNIERAIYSYLQQGLRNLKQVQNHPYLLYPDRLLFSFKQRLDDLSTQLEQRLRHHFQLKKERLHQLILQQKQGSPSINIEKTKHRFVQLERAFLQSFFNTLQNRRQRLSFIRDQIDRFVEVFVQRKKLKFETLSTHLEAIHPQKLLEKGYSILFDENKKSVILSAQDISLKQKVKVVLKDGFIKASVDEVHPGAL